jgi:psp operon transcriptional activator
MPIKPLNPEGYQAIGQSEAFLSLQERVSRAARTDRPVILIGERGTGKELAAARLHQLSERWNQAYVTLNCAALAPTLIESELFGHEAGAFTGAVRRRKGRFELADGGSLFLDEAANIPMTAQEKILRVVEYGQMERVGGVETLEVDVRLIAATNIDLRLAARQGRFRQDLLDRLSFEVITLPPLRARDEDILLLAGQFARRMAVELDRPGAPEFSPSASQALLDHAWPGNIRELKNVVERAVYLTDESTIGEILFDPFESEFAPAPAAPVEAGERAAAPGDPGDPDRLSLPEAVRSMEIQRIRRALEACRFNQRKAADSLGLTYHQFRGYYRKYRDVWSA